MHSSKGLEFDTVFIVDANEGITPHKKAVLPEDLEEERRLFYVAMTRAKKALYLYSAIERYNKVTKRSRFIDEILGENEEKSRK
jgi:DNA helicase-2/ATP-dependent DNA helicase PcrA